MQEEYVGKQKERCVGEGRKQGSRSSWLCNQLMLQLKTAGKKEHSNTSLFGVQHKEQKDVCFHGCLWSLSVYECMCSKTTTAILILNTVKSKSQTYNQCIIEQKNVLVMSECSFLCNRILKD